jgi:hypothetical protein
MTTEEERDAELIRKGRRVASHLQHAQLELGRLALEYAPIGDVSIKTGTRARLEEYADAIGVDPETLRTYRAVAHGWKDQEHVGALRYTTLKALLPVPNKEGLIARLLDTKAPTPSNQWTAAAAVKYARDHGLYVSRSTNSPQHPALTAVRRAETLLDNVEISNIRDDKERDMIMDKLASIRSRARDLEARIHELSVARTDSAMSATDVEEKV